jgi:hypothetical protein
VRGEEGSMQDTPQAGMQPQYQEAMKPQRGGVILALGIIGIVLCFITAIIAWVMGSGDLKQIDAGMMDPAGRGTTQAGKICGIIGTVLLILTILAIGLFFILGMGAALVSQHHSQ